VSFRDVDVNDDLTLTSSGDIRSRDVHKHGGGAAEVGDDAWSVR